MANVFQIMTADEAFLAERAGALPGALLEEIEAGLRLVLAL